MSLNLLQYLTLLWVVLFCNVSKSQDSLEYGHVANAEKIYLQLDGDVYTTNNVVWFKCILTCAADHTPTATSGVVYVELIDPLGQILETKLVKIVKGIGHGFFQLDRNYREGKHLIRAYTEWSKNYGSDFFFKTYIDLFVSAEEEPAQPIHNIELLNPPGLGPHLTASFAPLSLDSFHKKDLTSYIWFDDHKDTVLITRQKDGQYPLSVAVPNESRSATLQFETMNHRTYSKSILLDQGLDLQFFPESGNLVHGLPSKVVFKAVDFTGLGKQVAGQIITKGGLVIADFKSNHLGMGTFLMHAPDASESYLARLSTPAAEGSQMSYSLPPVAKKGDVLSVIARDSFVELIGASNYLVNRSIAIRISCRGLDYFEVHGFLKNGVFHTNLPLNTLPEGVLAFTMMNTPNDIVAERLFFNERPDLRINIELETDRASYLQRDRTQLLVETSAVDGPISASISLLVINRSQMGQRQDLRENILSHFLLSSDLQGEIESPGYYFDPDEVARAAHLDALLLTQGWRKYHYCESPEVMQFPVESSLSISGHVREAQGSKRKKAQLTLATLRKPQTFQTQITDRQGRFQFDINNQIAHNLNILIQSENKRGKKKNYTIELDTKQTPKITFDHLKCIAEGYSAIGNFVVKNLQRNTVEEARLFEGTTIDLEEVVVKAYKMTEARRKINEEYGMPNEVIDGEDIQDKAEDWSDGLYGVLKYNFPHQVDIRRYPGGVFAEVIGGGVTLVLVDGVPVRWPEYSFIPYIPPSEVISFEIIRNVPHFADLYIRVFPQISFKAHRFIKFRHPPPLLNRKGSVIAIYTKSGQGLLGVDVGRVNPKGVFRTVVPAFSPTREFYTPKYVKLQAEDWAKPDLRALVHWEPDLISDLTGQVSTEFYNADNLGEMQVVVEAISGTGQIGYKELIYQVRKRE